MPDPLSILVVDDEAPIAETLGDILETAGHRVEVALGGPQALARLQAVSYDVLFLDIKMPGMDGVEVLRHARRLVPQAVVIMMTGYARSDLTAEATREGALAVLTKPLPLDGVVRFLETLALHGPVLIVDDDPGFSQPLREVLESHGYTAAHTTDAAGAVEATQRLRPGVILLDMRLPDRNGYEVLGDLRRLDPGATIFFMTGYSAEFEVLIDRGLKEGARDCWQKPLVPRDVVQSLAAVRAERAAGLLRETAAHAG